VALEDVMSIVSVVVPFFNEEESLPVCCDHFDNIASKAEYDVDLIFVDDGSTDSSVDVISAFEFQHCYEVRIVKLSKNYGSHAAIRAGICIAHGDFCTYAGADLDEPENMIDVMYENIINGFDAIYIEKNTIVISALARITSLIYSALVRKYAVKEYGRGGINNIMFNRKIIDYLNNNIEANSSIQLQIINAGFKKTTIGMDYRKRVVGETKWTLSKKIKLFIDSFVSFSYAPIRAISIIGILFSMAGLIYAIITVISYFTNPMLIRGYATLVIILLIGFGITNLSLGIISEYLWRIFDAARSRPVFIVYEVVEKSVRASSH
jgi:dolichol-phosphate mannosyltransferase